MRYHYGMRKVFLYVLCVTLIFGGVYWYRFAESKCRVPVLYDIGDIDPRFNISKDEVRDALSTAESLWEDATGKNLFTYTPGTPFKVNFVYDERQDVTDESHEAQTVLDSKQNISEEIYTKYARMQEEYEDLKASYEARVARYEENLAAYNAEVSEWNSKGGAPEDAYRDLASRERALESESKELNERAQKLNDFTEALNELSFKGNQVVEDYNKDVAWYNTMFATEREFTQGEYHGDAISIYQFDDMTELKKVLAHELGHALSLDHVEGAASIMHDVMEGAFSGFALSSFDIAEYNRVCGE